MGIGAPKPIKCAGASLQRRALIATELMLEEYCVECGPYFPGTWVVVSLVTLWAGLGGAMYSFCACFV